MMRSLLFVCFYLLCFVDNGKFQELSCPEKNGRYSTPQCDAYIECANGVSELKLCPDGLLFNPKAPIFGYPCGYPIDVDCKGRGALQPAQPTELCPRQFGYFRMGDKQRCGQFVNCAHGDGYVFTCPEGLAFNENTYKCDWADQVDSCSTENFLGFNCPVEGNSLSDFETRLYPHPTDCQKFFICVNGRPRLQSCGRKEAFNDLTSQCDGIANVTRCAGFIPAKTSFDDY